MATARLEAILGLNTRSFEKGLAQARASANQFATKGLAAIGAAAVTAGAALAVGTRRVIGLGAELKHLQDQTGISAGNLAVLRRAFQDNGIEAEQVGKAVSLLQKSLVEAEAGSTRYAGAFDEMGVSAAELLKLDPAAQFSAVADALGRMENPAAMTAAAMKVFGEAGAGLLPLFKSAGGIQDAATALGGMAGVMDDFAASFERADTLLDRLPGKADQFFAGFAGGVTGSILGPLEAANEIDFTPLGQKLGAATAPWLEGMKDGSAFEVLGLELTRAAMVFGAKTAEALFDVAKAVPSTIGNALSDAASIFGVTITNRLKDNLRLISKIPGLGGLADKIPANRERPSFDAGKSLVDSLAGTRLGQYMMEAGNDIAAGAVGGMMQPGASISSIVDSAFEGRIGRLREANTVAAYRNQAAARFMASGGNSLDGGQAAGGVEALLKSIDKRLESFGASIAVHP